MEPRTVNLDQVRQYRLLYRQLAEAMETIEALCAEVEMLRERTQNEQTDAEK